MRGRSFVGQAGFRLGALRHLGEPLGSMDALGFLADRGGGFQEVVRRG